MAYHMTYLCAAIHYQVLEEHGLSTLAVQLPLSWLVAQFSVGISGLGMISIIPLLSDNIVIFSYNIGKKPLM